jgi:hypothetical protein
MIAMISSDISHLFHSSISVEFSALYCNEFTLNYIISKISIAEHLISDNEISGPK